MHKGKHSGSRAIAWAAVSILLLLLLLSGRWFAAAGCPVAQRLMAVAAQRFFNDFFIQVCLLFYRDKDRVCAVRCV